MKIVGIDPGISGAIALLQEPAMLLILGSKRLVSFYDTPTLQVKVGASVKSIMNANAAALMLQTIHPDYIVIEKVWAMPGGPGKKATMGVTSAFNFGMGFGQWLGIIAALQIPHEQVTPATWKKRMMPEMGKDKDASRLKAIQMFPDAAHQLQLKKHHNRAEALLLAEYGRRFRGVVQNMDS